MISPEDEKRLLNAVRSGDLTMLGLMIDEFPGYIKYANHRRESLLHIAADGGQSDLIKMLVARGVSPDIGRDFDSRGRVTPLYCAARSGRIHAAQVLLELGADVNAGIGVHSTPIIAAARVGNVEMVKLLLEYGADAKASYVLDTTPEPTVVTAALAAAENGHHEIVYLLGPI